MLLSFYLTGVNTTLQQSERILEKKYLPKRPIEELIEVVAERLDLSPELICSGSRKRLISDARALLAYLAVEETGHKATNVARILGIKRVSVHHAAKKRKKSPLVPLNPILPLFNWYENLPSPL
jgi:chromosomal replication initiation ATPase DnaA